MKLLLILSMIINLNGYGEIPAEGLEITVTEAHKALSGKMEMEIKGTLLCSGALTVTISRSSAGLEDQFCCGQCLYGNGQTEETLHFSPNSETEWFAHYMPAPNSHETIVYTFTDYEETRALTIHYNYSTEGIEDTEADTQAHKVLRDGILYIEYEHHTYHL